MTIDIILKIILLGVALSMDAFAVSVTDGLTYVDINKKRSFFIAGTFGVMQALMPLIGYWLVEGIQQIVDATAGAKAGEIMAIVVGCVAAALLLFIGGKMIFDSIKEMKKSEEEKEPKNFLVKEVLYFGFATAIDALGAGVTLHSPGYSTNITVWLHVTIIMVLTFGISLVGVFFGKQISKLFKGKFEITGIIGGSILILLAVWIMIETFVL